MNRAKGDIAIGDVIGDNAEAVNIGKLAEADLLFLHLFPDGIGFLLPPFHLSLDSGLVKRPFQCGFDPGDEITGILAELQKAANDGGAGLGMEHLKGQILQFLPHPLHTHAPGERGENIHGFPSDTGAFIGAKMAKRPHIMRPVRQLHQQHPHIAGHGDQQFAEVFRLFGFPARQFQLVQLGDTIHQLGNFLAEKLGNLGIGRGSVFDCVMQERGDDCGVIQLQLCENCSHFKRMAEIGLAAGTFLRGMSPRPIDIGAVQQSLIRIGIIGPDHLNKFKLPYHGLT